MNNEQKLYHHKIYQRNRLLEEFKQVCGIENEIVSFSILNFHNRSFNWYVVNKNRWVFDEQIILNINHCIRDRQTQWKSLFEKLNKLDIKELTDSIKYFVRERNAINWSDKEARREFHFHLLNLYQYYPHEAHIGIDGVIYRNFVEKGKRLLFAKGELLTDTDVFKNFNLYPWIKMAFVYESGDKVRSLSAQEQKQDIKYTEATFKNEIEEIKESSCEKSTSNYKEYFHYLVPLIMGYEHPDDPKRVFDGVRNEDKKYLLDDKDIMELVTNFKYILCFPVYDTFIDKRLYGNFCGNITIPFAFKDDRDEFLKEHQKKIEENLFLLIQ